MTTAPSEIILVVESDPEISDLIGRQTLTPSGYQVVVASDGASAIRQVVRLQPDVMITNLNLPGLSGKDLLVALSSQGIKLPMIVMAEKGQETNVIQAFRLGASDYLPLPVREAEVLSIVERALEQGREIRAREKLDQQLRETNLELERRLRDLNALFAVGRAVISITDQRTLFNKIIEAVTTVTDADMGWLALKDENGKSFRLAAQRNLPESMARKTGQPVDDGLENLVAVSAETLSVQGPPLQKFKISSLGNSAMVIPVKIKKEAIGLLTLVRKTDKPFASSEQALAEAIAGYTSISLVNARLFRALEQNAQTSHQGDKRKGEQLLGLRQELQAGLDAALKPVESILDKNDGGLTAEQKRGLSEARNSLKNLIIAINREISKQNPSLR